MIKIPKYTLVCVLCNNTTAYTNNEPIEGNWLICASCIKAEIEVLKQMDKIRS